uniref:Expansin-like EG45 domain-containing protein n=1 Tax=Eutreptiella gymnastica TaxID=73025 RepID=A0A6T1YXE8_9EUGL
MLICSLQPLLAATGYASCYGNYQNHLGDNNVACGMGNFMTGEDFTYTTAICQTWASTACGSCYQVQCTGGKTANVACTGSTTNVRVIDTLGGACTGTGQNVHVFDLSTVPYSALATEGGNPIGCSGEYYVEYSAVSCTTAGLVTGGLKIGLMQNQADPWCPPFWFSNVGEAGGLWGVEVSPDSGTTWHRYTRNTGNGARWDCTNMGGAGTYLNNPISFRLELCDINQLPNTCAASGVIQTFTNALPSNWCANGASPCTSNSWQLSTNFGSGTSTTSSGTGTTTTSSGTSTSSTSSGTGTTSTSSGTSTSTTSSGTSTSTTSSGTSTSSTSSGTGTSTTSSSGTTTGGSTGGTVCTASTCPTSISQAGSSTVDSSMLYPASVPMDITAAHSFNGGGSMTFQTASTISISAAVTFNIPVAFQAATLTIAAATAFTSTLDMSGSGVVLSLITSKIEFQSSGHSISGTTFSGAGSAEFAPASSGVMASSDSTWLVPLGLKSGATARRTAIDSIVTLTSCGDSFADLTVSSGTALLVYTNCTLSSNTAYSTSAGTTTFSSGSYLIFDEVTASARPLYMAGFSAPSDLRVEVISTDTTTPLTVTLAEYVASSCVTSFSNSSIDGCPSGASCTLSAGQDSTNSSQCVILYTQSSAGDDSNDAWWGLLALLVIPLCAVGVFALVKLTPGPSSNEVAVPVPEASYSMQRGIAVPPPSPAAPNTPAYVVYSIY